MAHISPQSLETEAQYLKGVGPKNAALLAKLGIHTVRDVLYHLPRRYEDRRETPPIMLLRPGRASTVVGRLADVRSKTIGRGRVLVEGVVQDETGEIVLCYFNQPWVGRQLQQAVGQEVVAFGNVREGARRRLELHSAEWEATEGDALDGFAKIVPVYPLSEGVPQRVVRRAAASAVEHFLGAVEDPLPAAFREEHGLPDLQWTLRQLHAPEDEEKRVRARQRAAFEEFFYLQLALQIRRHQARQEVGISFPVSTCAGGAASSLFDPGAGPGLWAEVEALFPFELTAAQKRVIGEIWRDMEAPAPMNRLVQGDVGSGKTAIAAAAMLAAVRCGWQAALMAPTEILAEQHYLQLVRMLEPAGVPVALLVGKLGAKARRKSLQQAAGGEARIVVGTHALIQEAVAFDRLGLAVIDEQHRFGVVQRMALRQKGDVQPDVLVMTATPIPRSLTMTFYGDLDLSVVDELPPGRKPITTHWRRPADRGKVYEAVDTLVAQGRQAYFVCPMISENETVQAQAAVDLHYRLSTGAFAHRRAGLLHGQLKSAEKEAVMQAFREGGLDILVATVVIEVGVDVPNASVMVVEDANRFGLAQLHQLRGRVGRGAHKSFCILIADSTSPEVEDRMRVLEQTQDGFKIAEEDLRLRGPGDVMGTQQHGRLDLRIADLVQDGKLLEVARQAARKVLEGGGLGQPGWQNVLERVKASRTEEALVTVS